MTCRTQPGRPGFQIRRAFTARQRRIELSHAIRAPRVSDPLRFYGPAAKNRRAARNPGDPGSRFAGLLQFGHKEAARRTARNLGDPGGRDLGSADLGRWGPHSGAPARRGVGKTVDFLNGDCEGLVFLPSTPLSRSGCRACDVFPRSAGLPRPKGQRRSYTQRRN